MMTPDTRTNLLLLAGLFLFLAFVIPATWRMYADAEFGLAVTEPFLEHGVKP